MVDKTQGPAGEDESADAPAPVAAPTPRRAGHRGMDPRETIAELTAKAHEISQSAGTKVGAAMKNVIGAAAGLTGFAVESARDLIQYMVRRGQMTQIEGDKLLREVEAAHGTRSKPAAKADAAPKAQPARPASAPPAKTKAATPEEKAPEPKSKARATKEASAAPRSKKAAAPGSEKSAPKTAAKSPSKTTTKSAEKEPASKPGPAADKGAKKAAEKPAASKPAAKKAADKGAAKKSAPKGSASRTESAPRPKAAAKSAPIRKKK